MNLVKLCSFQFLHVFKDILVLPWLSHQHRLSIEVETLCGALRYLLHATYWENVAGILTEGASHEDGSGFFLNVDCSFLLLVVRPRVPSSVLAPSSDALCS